MKSISSEECDVKSGNKGPSMEIFLPVRNNNNLINQENAPLLTI